MPKFATTLLAATWLLLCISNSCRDPRDNRTPLTAQLTIVFSPKEKKTARFLNVHSFTPGREGANPEVTAAGRSHTVMLDPDVRKLVFTVKYFRDDDKVLHIATLTIKYTCKATLISPQCGCAYQYTIDNVDFDEAKEIRVLNSQLSSYNDSPDVQIYL
ncbi:MAG: DUF6452 family protein [Bacteroidota bacterium]